MLSPLEINTIVVGGVGAIVSTLTYASGARKGKAEARLTDVKAARERVALDREQAEASQAEAAAQLDALAGGLNARLDTLTAGMQQVRHEMTPNHGGSIKDAIRRIETTLDKHTTRFDYIDREIEGLHREIDGLQRELSATQTQIKGLGHEIGDIRTTRDRDHGDYDERLRRLEHTKEHE